MLNDLLCVLKEVTDYAANEVCLHESTHRGGIIWEICDDCGAAWSDDRNPKPPGETQLPKEIRAAYNMLSKYDT